jgi:hypothetical protein
MHALYHLARADFLERTRRYGFLVTLVGTLLIAYQVHLGNVEARLGSYRGMMNSAWLGGVVTLTITTLLSLVGFYLVKNAVERDRFTRVGEILATTPISRLLYCLGKTLSNFFVLATLVGVLAVSAVVLQFAAGESGHIDPAALLLPFVFVALPAMLVIAAVAVFFECVPLLRGGFGNVVYFFLWAVPLLVAMEVKGAPDLYGARTISESMAEAARLRFPDYKEGFSFTIGGLKGEITGIFEWNGVHWTPGLIASRLQFLALAFFVAFLASLFFDRFDPSRSRGTSRRVTDPADARPSVTKAVPLDPARAIVLSLAPVRHGFHFGAMVAAELRLMLRQARKWWFLVAAGLLAAQLIAPLNLGRSIFLPIAWLWPVLLWSSLGSREKRYGTEGLVFASPHLLARQWSALWTAGVILSVATGAGMALRLILAGDMTLLAAWAAGAMFVPSLALALGAWTGSGKFFEALYTITWYLGPMNKLPQLDYAAAVDTPERAAITTGFVIATAALLAASFAGRKRQLDTA